MSLRRRRPVGAVPAAAVLVSALLVGVSTAPPAGAYSDPSEVPDPFQEYSAQDYADALWNLETSTAVRSLERESRGDCEVFAYEVRHPLELGETRRYVHLADEDGWWCDGEEGEELREEFDTKDDEDEHFFHGRPYENTTHREPYYGTWADVTGNGVSSRTEIHARDLGNNTFTVSGTYLDHYTGQRVDITETETHGEHMVPVGHTWPEMQHRPREDRVAYYNDPMNLTSTIGEINREKAGHTPSEWMPSNEDAHCAYSLTWVHIANKHELSLFQRDIDQLRGQLWDCLHDQLDGAQGAQGDEGEGSEGEESEAGGIGAESRSPDLDWQSLPPETEADDGTETSGAGPTEPYSVRDHLDAVWHLENHVRLRSVEREEHQDCDVQTHTTTHPRSGETRTYARVISPENTYCFGDEGDQLREELEAEAADDNAVFHSNPMDGQPRENLRTWVAGADGLNTRQHVLFRDLEDVEWDATGSEVVSATFEDPYTGEEGDYAGPSTVIDHLLPVAHAWTEMEHRDAQQRQAYYNDPENLVAVPEESSEARAGEAPRNWMPDNEGFHCQYAVAWTHTAAAHEISLFGSDIAQLRQSLHRCIAEETGSGGSDEGQRRAELDWPELPPW
ncbi:GmrSD restriction endonuclease domain-containing protein [Nesterenkonia sphaerica]|uniref:DUF1524 domain-containing protein n=1 Tax=Nesterenkonia sphaerica TaxID=1804988 RepID=A0A5R9AA98_9MICC|nr:DUF1524 domain-containing protein [Nesterenkonia sphaerica]TLP75563.1 DUF1524 domain-containing protein [Nesterenkonia sphaerica]